MDLAIRSAKSRVTVFLISLVLCCSCYSTDVRGESLTYYDDDEDSGRPFDLRVDLSTGYRTDEIQWNIASDITGTRTPNIISELTWEDLQSWQIKGAGQLAFHNGIVVDGALAYAAIFSGKNQDSDYDGNNRTLENSRSNNSSDDGDLLDFTIGLGYRFDLIETFSDFALDKLTVTPLVGYGYHQQNLRMQDGFQTIPATGPFAGLDSTYESQWNGAWLGFEIEGGLSRFSGIFRLEYHVADYYAEANWNLRTDFKHPVSFEHETDGAGFNISSAVGYQLTDNWSLNMGIQYKDWQADPGVIRFFLASGSVTEQRLNVVDWTSFSVSGGLQYKW